MASAPTTPSSARRGIHSWMRRGNSCNTSRQSPISSVRTEPSGFSRGRQTRWTEEARDGRIHRARFGLAISVSIGQEAVIHPTGVYHGLQHGFPTGRGFMCEYYYPDACRHGTRRLSGMAFLIIDSKYSRVLWTYRSRISLRKLDTSLRPSVQQVRD